MMNSLRDWLSGRGLDAYATEVAVAFLAAIVLLLVCVVVNLVAKRLILQVISRLVRRSTVTWDDVFLEKKVFSRLSHLAPALVIHIAAPFAFEAFERIVAAVQTLAIVYIAVMGLSAVDAFLNASLDIYRRFDVSRRVPLKGFVQVLKIAVFFLGAIFILSNLLGRSPLAFLSGLGAFTAVLLLVFKDPILGLVAGVQLTANNMVRVGDWIEMPKFGADGDVIDVSLTTIKVQNWDKTISSIPAYSLVSDSFRNWRGMSESGGRRIKRSLSIDMNSVRFCDEDMLERFWKIESLKPYLERKMEEVAAHNREANVDESVLINGRRLTNLGTFRAYVEAYLRQNPKIHEEMTFLVRQLAPTEHGLPLEIYVFSNDQVWANYEAIQADIFDHLLAALPLFDLRVYQRPAGADLAALSAKN